MDTQQADEYQAGLQAIRDLENREPRPSTPEERFHRLNEIMALARSLGMRLEEDEAEIEIVRQRWVRLKEGYP